MTAPQTPDRPVSTGSHDVRLQPVPGGFVLRGAEGPSLPFQLTQGIVLAVGAALAGVALALILAWGAQVSDHAFALLGGATLLGGAGLLLLWFATRGGTAELQLDLARGELREVVRHRIGQPTLVGRHALGDAPTLEVDLSGPPAAPCSLILRTGGEGGLCIAQGEESDILDLCHRLDAGLRAQRPAPLAA